MQRWVQWKIRKQLLESRIVLAVSGMQLFTSRIYNYLEVRENTTLEHSRLAQNILDRFGHALHAAKQSARISRNGYAIFLQTVLNVARPSIPLRGRLTHHRHHLETHALPLGKLVNEAQVLRCLDSIVQAGSATAPTSTGDIELAYTTSWVRQANIILSVAYKTLTTTHRFPSQL